MINLTSLEDLVISLITNALEEFEDNPEDNSDMSFIFYPEGYADILWEFTAGYEYDFEVWKRDSKDDLLIRDCGENIYLIPNILPDDYVERILDILNQQSIKLSDRYKLINYKKKLPEKNWEADVYSFVKVIDKNQSVVMPMTI